VTLYVIALVCLTGQPCDKEHYIDFQAFRAPPGVIICGVPATTTIIQSVRAPGRDMYIRQRCELRRD